MNPSRPRHLFLTGALALPLLLASARSGHAGYAIDLAHGGTVLAHSYRFDGDKLFAYRASGVLELSRAAVKEIRETPDDDGAVPAPAAAPVRAPEAEAPEASAPGQAEERERLEREITRQIILGHRDLLFARNRGEPKSDLDRRHKELDKLEKRRASLR